METPTQTAKEPRMIYIAARLFEIREKLYCGLEQGVLIGKPLSPQERTSLRATETFLIEFIQELQNGKI